MPAKKRILLHACCGPCATVCIERLLIDNWHVDVFYSNSNIYPESEWLKRFESLEKTTNYFNVNLYYDEYNHKDWLKHIKGFELEPERGQRCSLCFKFSFKQASLKARAEGYNGFTTSLTVSPHKNSTIIFDIGNSMGNFKEYNFKKKDGYKRSLELSEKIGLYRQNYCGCEFSIGKSN